MELKSLSITNFTKNLVLFGGVLTTIIINPWTNYDPINIPKMVVLSTFAACLVPFLVSMTPSLFSKFKYQLPIYLLLPISLGVSLWKNEGPRIEHIWGTWGRNTGIVALVSLYVFCFATSAISHEIRLFEFQKIFHRLGYFITSYTLIQLLELDPIAWSQKLTFATFGNLNFMSAFLGLTSVSMITALVLTKNWSTKIFYVLIALLNSYLIIISESIQGLAMIFVGISALLLLKLRRGIKKVYFKLIILLTAGLATLAAIGSAGMGPLGKWLVQQTVLFRIDYWQAAINMVKSSPLTGIGVDSYGDFYREFRESSAVARTGPSRVSNTAHNIFLDYASGSGLFAALSLFGLFCIVVIVFYSREKRDLIASEDFVLLPLISSYFIFCLISINQIGVSIWGFIITGYYLGLSTSDLRISPSSFQSRGSLIASSKQKLESATPKKFIGKSNWLIITFAASFFAGVFAFTFSMIPARADAKFLKIYSSQSISKDLLEESHFTTFHREKLIELAISSGNGDYVLPATRALLSFNPRAFYGWSVMAFSNSVNPEESKLALEKLVTLDPKNPEIKLDLESRN